MEVIDLTQPEIVDLTGDDEEKEEEKEEVLSDMTDAYDECCICYDYDYVFWNCNVCVARWCNDCDAQMHQGIYRCPLCRTEFN